MSLRIGRPFAYLRSRVGLERRQELQLGSPFDYAETVHAVSGGGLPLPDEPGFLSAAMDRAMHYIRQTQGRAFVLFTSYGMLDKAAQILGPHLRRWGIRCWRRASAADAGAALARFKNTPNSVLLGTDSFWQGVDVRARRCRT